MLQRPDVTKWLWCLVVVYAGPGWSPVGGVSVRTPPKNPSTIEAQAKFFQDFFSVQLSPYKIEFGHVCEDPNTWEQRYEKKDFKNHRDMGKVRWGDKQGGYGEHYWDLNHAGHAGNHGSDDYDDGSYNHDLDHTHDEHDSYDEPSEQNSKYSVEEYDPEQAAKYDDSGRAKRAHPRIKTERKLIHEEEMYEDTPRQEKIHRKSKEQLQTAPTQQIEKVINEDKEPPKRRRQQSRRQNNQEYTSVVKKQADVNQKEEPNQQDQKPQYYVKGAEKQFAPYEQDSGVRQHHQPENIPAASARKLFLEPTTGQLQTAPTQRIEQVINEDKEYKEPPKRRRQQRRPQNNQEYTSDVEKQADVNQKEEPNQQDQKPQYYVKRAEKQFVPYEQGSGVRQHHQPENIPAASAPRLFLEPTTGHVVDRATGQAYVLQPIAINNYS